MEFSKDIFGDAEEYTSLGNPYGPYEEEEDGDDE